MILRPETRDDVDAVHDLTALAFEDPAEADVLRRLRRDGDLLLSLTATLDDRIAGYLAATPVAFTDLTDDWCALGPVCVHPEYRRRGIAKALITQGLSQLRRSRFTGCVLMGHPEIYASSGFRAGRFTWRGLPSPFLLHNHFEGPVPTGGVRFADAIQDRDRSQATP